MIQVATSTTQKDPITFTDEEMENEDTIEAFLDVIYTWSIENLGNSDYTSLHLNLISFARKWECQTILEMVERGIEIDVAGGAKCDVFEHFLLAISFGKYELAAECLRDRPGMKWSQQPWVIRSPLSSTTEEQRSMCQMGPIGGHSVFDLSASAYESFADIPLEVIWALLRSWNLARSSTDNKPFETKLGDEFVKIMRTACEYLLSPAYLGYG